KRPRSIESVATVSDFLTVGSSGGGRISIVLPWNKEPPVHAAFKLFARDCHGGAPVKRPRSIKSVATVSDFLTVGSSGDGRNAIVLPWIKQPPVRAAFKLFARDCHAGATESVATVSDFLTVGSSGDGRIANVLPWNKEPPVHAAFKLIT